MRIDELEKELEKCNSYAIEQKFIALNRKLQQAEKERDLLAEWIVGPHHESRLFVTTARRDYAWKRTRPELEEPVNPLYEAMGAYLKRKSSKMQQKTETCKPDAIIAAS